VVAATTTRAGPGRVRPAEGATPDDGTVSDLGIVARLSDAAGIDQIRAHRLRHTAAMDVLAAGGTLTEAKELLGHVYTATTMTYAKVDLPSLRELVVPFGQVPR
jgi:integrase